MSCSLLANEATTVLKCYTKRCTPRRDQQWKLTSVRTNDTYSWPVTRTVGNVSGEL